MSERCTEALFLTDVASHRMTVVHDHGVHRHLHFAKPGTGCMHFDLITWPGYLAYSGDMGCFVFSRLHDMLEFFRSKPEGKHGLHINQSYWSEKLQAHDRHGGHLQYNAKSFREWVVYQCREIRHNMTRAEFRGFSQEVRDEVLSVEDDGDHAAHRALFDFSHNGRCFRDSWEADFMEYTFRFTWCCYALSWGIAQYDASKRSEAA